MVACRHIGSRCRTAAFIDDPSETKSLRFPAEKVSFEPSLRSTQVSTTTKARAAAMSRGVGFLILDHLDGIVTA